jgi:hypothetical protein
MTETTTTRYLALVYCQWEDLSHRLNNQELVNFDEFEKLSLYHNGEKMTTCSGYCLVFDSMEEARKHYPKAQILTLSCKD